MLGDDFRAANDGAGLVAADKRGFQRLDDAGVHPAWAGVATVASGVVRNEQIEQPVLLDDIGAIDDTRLTKSLVRHCFDAKSKVLQIKQALGVSIMEYRLLSPPGKPLARFWHAKNRRDGLIDRRRTGGYDGRKAITCHLLAKGPIMTDTPPESSGIDALTLKNALKAFKKRLKLTALDDDSRLGHGPFSGGALGLCAIRPPDQYPPAVWRELVHQGKLRDGGHGLYQLADHPNPGKK